MWLAARSRAKKKGFEFSILVEDIVIPEFCPLLSIRLDRTPRSGGPKAGYRRFASPSLDRIENQLGYVRGNIWVISWRANHLKSDATLGEMVKLVRNWKKHLIW